LKQVLNRGQSKLSSTKDMEGAELESSNAALMAKVEKPSMHCARATIRVTGGKAKTKGLDKAVKTEAMRIARALVKDALKREGEKVPITRLR